MKTYDYYSKAKSLAEELRLAGFSHYRDEILRSMEEGETGTEIFMMMRSQLARFLVEKVVPENLSNRVTRLHDRLDDALK